MFRLLRRKQLPPTIMRFLTFRSVLMHHDCDAKCPQSAKYWVRTPAGDVYLCGHHFRKHRAYFAEHGYETYEVT